MWTERVAQKTDKFSSQPPERQINFDLKPSPPKLDPLGEAASKFIMIGGWDLSHKRYPMQNCYKCPWILFECWLRLKGDNCIAQHFIASSSYNEGSEFIKTHFHAIVPSVIFAYSNLCKMHFLWNVDLWIFGGKVKANMEVKVGDGYFPGSSWQILAFQNLNWNPILVRKLNKKIQTYSNQDIWLTYKFSSDTQKGASMASTLFFIFDLGIFNPTLILGLGVCERLSSGP